MNLPHHNPTFRMAMIVADVKGIGCEFLWEFLELYSSGYTAESAAACALWEVNNVSKQEAP